MLTSLPVRRGRLLSLCLTILIISGVSADEKPCTTHDNGKYYDLSPLQASKDFEIQGPSGQTILLNVCQNVRTEIFGLGEGIDAGDVGGTIKREHGHFALGKFNTTVTVADSRPRILMSEGSLCKDKDGKSGNIRGSSIIEFVCDATLSGAGTPRLVAELPPGTSESGCAYVFEWKTPYACSTSEGGGFVGFLFILAIIFIVILLTYTILGTLYNRFVLQLRGFDQIPQFSIEGMKYHGREAFDWIKDMITALDIGGQRGNGNAYGGIPTSATNPVSHQSHVSRFGTTDDLEGHDSDPIAIGNNGFVRPQVAKSHSASFPRPEINPISHQSQVNAARSLSFTATSPGIPQSPAQSQLNIPKGRTTLAAQVREPTQEERDFMLGEDEDDAEELVDIAPPPPIALQQSSSSSSSQAASLPALTKSSGSSSSESTAAARGRDLGGGETTTL